VIRAVRFIPAGDADVARGLLAFVKIDFGPLVLDGVTLRKHGDGRLGLSWPERTDRAGRRHPLVRPVDDAARREIEEAVLRELTRQELEGDRASLDGESKP
jgi:DNA-binding cell septation regulator SpoVG